MSASLQSPAPARLDKPTGLLTPTRLAETARRVAADTGFWRPRVRFDAADRYYARLEVTPEYEVWLLTWLPGQGTGIHDHGGSSGAFTVVQGALTERTFTTSARRPAPWELPVGAIRAFGPRHTHEVVNHGSVPAVSIHAYAPALTSMSYYEELPGGGIILRSTSPVDR